MFLTIHRELYKVSALVSNFTKEQVRFVIGISALVKVLAAGYAELHGRALEGLSRLFTKDVRIYVYPMLARGSADEIGFGTLCRLEDQRY